MIITMKVLTPETQRKFWHGESWSGEHSRWRWLYRRRRWKTPCKCATWANAGWFPRRKLRGCWVTPTRATLWTMCNPSCVSSTCCLFTVGLRYQQFTMKQDPDIRVKLTMSPLDKNNMFSQSGREAVVKQEVVGAGIKKKLDEYKCSVIQIQNWTEALYHSLSLTGFIMCSVSATDTQHASGCMATTDHPFMLPLFIANYLLEWSYI